MSGQQKVDASLHNARAAFVDNSATGSTPPQTPHHGGGGSSYPKSSNDLDLENHQSINHNHCPLDDCDPFTEHRYPDAIADHIQFHFMFEKSSDALKRYGPDVVNKTVALMKVKIVKEKFFPANLGGYFRSQCEKILAGSNVPTGEDHQRRRDALTNYVDPKQKAKNKPDYFGPNVPPRKVR